MKKLQNLPWLLLMMVIAAPDIFSMYFLRAEKSEVNCFQFHPHPLRFSNINNGWSCNGIPVRDDNGDISNFCLRGIIKPNMSDSIPRFRCGECDYDLCDLCAQAQTKGFDYPKHEHKLYCCFVDNGWICNGALEKGGCSSFVTDYRQTGGMNRYRCDECNFDLCERCMRNGGVEIDSQDLCPLDQDGEPIDPMIRSSKEVKHCDLTTSSWWKPFDKIIRLPSFGGEESAPPLSREGNKTCYICYQMPIDCCLVHIDEGNSHICCCRTCAKKLEICPFCRCKIDLVITPVFVKGR